MARLSRIGRHLYLVLTLTTNYRGERRQTLRRYLFDIAAHVSPSLAVDINGLRYHLATADKGVSRPLFMSGNNEQRVLETVVRILEGRGQGLIGKEFIDIGANIGTTTLPALAIFNATRVWAFEPNAENLAFLRCNLMANGLYSRATVFPVALSHDVGLAQLELSPDNWGDHRVVVSTDEGAFQEIDRDRVAVDIATFDTLAAQHGIDMRQVGLVWMDTQGHEGKVLAGASSILRSDVPLLTEYWPYGLRRSQCLDTFHELVARHFSTFVDLSDRGAAEHAACDIASLEGTYRRRKFTDVLLM